MSITFTADLDFNTLPTKQVRMVDQYPGLDNQDFAGDGYETDAEGFYIETVIATDYVFEQNFANANFYSVLNAIDHNLYVVTRDNGGIWVIKAGDVPALLAKAIKARNSAKLGNHERETVRNGNMIDCGIDREYLERSLSIIMEICQTAIKAGRDVSWA